MITTTMNNNRGFALVATISLMVLLTLIILAIMSLSTIEIRQSKVSNHKAQAMANARLAVMIALGELQKYAGADQVVTARGGILGEPDENEGESNQKNPWLTGVWPTLDDALGDTVGRDLALRKVWRTGAFLVSGNERFSLNNNLASHPKGYFTPASQTPKNGVDMGKYASDGKIWPVVAPRVSTQTGGYAYWVEDEGVKARVNLDNPFENVASTDLEKAANGVLAQRLRADWIGHAASQDDAAGFIELADYGNIGSWDKLISLQTTTLINHQSLEPALKIYGSDLTTVSESLLIDVKRGGFKKDLSSAFQMTRSDFTHLLGGQMFESDLLFPQLGNEEAAPVGATQIAMRPRGTPWLMLHDYANLRVNAGAQLDMRKWVSSSPLDRNATTELLPVVTRVQYFFDVSYEDNGDDSYTVMFHLFPMIVLWNPYDVDLQADPFKVSITANRNASGGWVELAYDYTLEGDFQWADGSDSSVAPPPVNFGRASFGTTTAFEIPAGKAVILTTPGAHQRYNDRHTMTLTQKWQDGFGLSLPGKKIKFSQAPSIKIKQHGFTSNNYGSNSRMNLGVFSLHIENLNWNIDKTINSFIPQIRPPAAPLVGNSPRWGGVLSRKSITSQLTPLLGGGSANDYPANRIGHYNVRAHGYSYVGVALNLPPSLITGTFTAGSDVTSYVKPDIVNAASDTGPHYAYVGPSDTSSGAPEEKLFHILRTDEPLLTLATLSHASLGRGSAQLQYRGKNIGDDLEPTFAIGTSLRPPHHAASALRANTLKKGEWLPKVNENLNDSTAMHCYRMDSAFLHNNAIWDGYYLSGSDAKDAGFTQFLNSNIHFVDSSTLTDYKSDDLRTRSINGLSKLKLKGGFNVNSTSRSAWKALIASTVGLESSSGSRSSLPGYTRRGYSSDSVKSITAGSTPFDSDNYTHDGRGLTDIEVDTLAGEIVRQVKLRGPFPSLSAFINRALFPDSCLRAGLTTEQVCNKGALQAAIDGSSENTDLNANLSRDSWVDSGNLPNIKIVYREGENGSVYKEALENSLAYGASMSITQMDLLAKIGSQLTVRSDTFIIHGYGESRDTKGEILARARCEVTVQRMPEWVGARITPEEDPSTDATGEASKFGRSFKITAFKWTQKN